MPLTAEKSCRGAHPRAGARPAHFEAQSWQAARLQRHEEPRLLQLADHGQHAGKSLLGKES